MTEMANLAEIMPDLRKIAENCGLSGVIDAILSIMSLG
jgi:hypothetical protein